MNETRGTVCRHGRQVEARRRPFCRRRVLALAAQRLPGIQRSKEGVGVYCAAQHPSEQVDEENKLQPTFSDNEIERE